jgi:hypothetical protein
LLQSNNIQNYVAQKITLKLSSAMGTKVQIKHISFDIFNQLVVNDLFVKDKYSDTLLYSKKVTFALDAINLSKKIIRVDKIELDHAHVRLYIDSTKQVSIKYVIDNLLNTSNDTSTQKGWDVSFNNIGFINSRFSLVDFENSKQDSGINFSNLRLHYLTIRVKNLAIKDKIASFKINKLSFSEQSGFRLNYLSAKMSIGHNLMHFDDVNILTPESDISAPRVYFDFNMFGDFSHFVEKVNVVFDFDKTKASFSDIAYFAPALWGVNEPFQLSGIAKGKISDLKCKNLHFKLNSTSFNGNISLMGLPNIQSTYIYVDSKSLNINPIDLRTLYIPKIEGNRLNLPSIIDKLGLITFKGNFTGFINDFVAFGTFTTELGSVTTDLSLKPESKTKLAIIGSVNSKQFDFGRLLSKENIIGTASIQLNTNIIIENNKNVSGIFDSNINQFIFNGYNYSSILAKGELKNNAFNGSISLTDKNINLDILGQFDLTKTIPEFNFSANLEKAELNKLNITHADSMFNISGQLVANFKGNSLSNIDGEIELKKALLEKSGKTLQVNNLLFQSQKNSTGRQINIKSNILDASIIGDFELGSFSNNLIQTLKMHLPSSFKTFKTNDLISNNKFDLNVTFKSTKAIFDFFAPGTFLAENSTLTGNFKPSDSNVKLQFNSELLQYNTNKLQNLKIAALSNNDSLQIHLSTNRFISGNQIDLTEFTTHIKGANDRVYSHVWWNNHDSIGGKSSVFINSSYQKNKSQNPVLNIHILPCKIFPADSAWVIKESFINIDTTSIQVPYFAIMQGLQEFEAKGKISKNEIDTLTCKFENFDLQNLRFLIQSSAFNFKGKVDGVAYISDFYNKRLINSDIIVDKLTINNELIGNTDVHIKWDNSDQKITFSAEAENDNIKSAIIKGFVKPGTSEIYLDADVNNIGLKLFQPPIENVFTLKKGNISGNINLSGKTYQPVLNGNLSIENALFTLKYLNTTYNFNTSLKIQNNDFILNNVKILDSDKNFGFVNGRIINSNFSNISIDLKINISKLRVLNTGINDNNPFYGNAFASGEINITGPLNKIKIDVIHARTEGKTIFAIPINNRLEVKENYFLNFSNKKSQEKSDSTIQAKKYEVNLSGLSLSMNLEVTPEAEVQLVFDPKLGDVMTSHGKGNLKIDVTTTGDIRMLGDYYVEGGTYWFTLQNLINKKFELQSGGVISWTGNPIDANLDVKAIYRTKASLYNLIMDQRDEMKKRINVDCNLGISGKLLNPDIKYNITLPNANEDIRNALRDAINTDEALSMQFFSLLVINNFIPNSTNNLNDLSSQNRTNTIGKDLATTTSIELLSSQLSTWLSQISKDFDVGVNYRPGENKMTNQEVELALSTQLLNDRININGNFDVVGNQAVATTTNKTTNIVGDVNVEFKLTEKLKLKAYNHSNDQILYEQTPYTQGIGVFYREEFSTFGELSRRYYRYLFPLKQDTSKTSVIKATDTKK